MRSPQGPAAGIGASSGLTETPAAATHRGVAAPGASDGRPGLSATGAILHAIFDPGRRRCEFSEKAPGRPSTCARSYPEPARGRGDRLRDLAHHLDRRVEGADALERVLH